MTTFKAILFVLSCFSFIMACTYVLQSVVDAITHTITQLDKVDSKGYSSLIAALSFTYMMTYLFIW